MPCTEVGSRHREASRHVCPRTCPAPPAVQPYPVTGPVGCGAFSSSDAEAQPLLASYQAGRVALTHRPRDLGLQQGQAQAASPPLSGAVVILGSQGRDGDCILRFYHAFSPHTHLHGCACPSKSLHSLVVLSVLQSHAVHLWVWGGPGTHQHPAAATPTPEH